MPSIVTHYILAKEAILNMRSHLSKLIEDHPKEFNIGSSGPDFFFYYNCLPWTNQKDGRRVAYFGSVIHAHSINDFFKMVFTTINNNPSPQAISHVAGLLCHWAMDKTCHPYIFYVTNGQPLSSFYHREAESTIDSILLKRKLNQTTTTFKPYTIVNYDLETVEALYQVYSPALKMVYNLDLDKNTVARALQHFYKAQRYLYDPKDIKKRIISTFETKISFIPRFISSMILPKSPLDPLDLLNEHHKPWHHPCTNEISTESFIELYDNSLEVAKEALELFNQYILHQVSLDDLLAYIGNQSFETALSTYRKMEYADCIFTQKR